MNLEDCIGQNISKEIWQSCMARKIQEFFLTYETLMIL